MDSIKKIMIILLVFIIISILIGCQDPEVIKGKVIRKEDTGQQFIITIITDTGICIDRDIEKEMYRSIIEEDQIEIRKGIISITERKAGIDE